MQTNTNNVSNKTLVVLLIYTAKSSKMLAVIEERKHLRKQKKIH